MEYSTHQNGATFDLTFRDKLTFADGAMVKAVIDEVKMTDCELCVLDVSALTAIDSAGLGMLLMLNDALASDGKKLEISGAAGPVQKMFDISNFSEMVPIRS